MILKLITLVILVFGEGARGHFLPGSEPSPVRGHSQGKYWPEYENVEGNAQNSYLYHSPTYRHFVDHQRYFHQSAAHQTVNPAQQIVHSAQEVYHQQDTPLQQIYSEPEPAVYHQQLPFQSPYFLNRQQAPASTVPATTETTIPVLVRLPNNQALIVPVKAVYTLPPFLERLIQSVQGYYSVYNPIEELTLDRPLFHPTTTSTASPVDSSSHSELDQKKTKTSSTTESAETSTKKESLTGKISTLAVFEVSPTTTSATTTEVDDDDTHTEEESDSQNETTTDPSNYITPETTPSDLDSEGYTYNKPAQRSVLDK